MKTYDESTLALIDAEVKAQAGNHYDALKAEFVDFHNDLRTASTVELMQLGLSSESAHNILYFIQQVNAGMDPTCKQKVTMPRMKEDEAPLFAVEA
jgi:hypothetical protein